MAKKDCPHCGGSGWKVVERDGGRVAVRCECGTEDQQARVLTRARIPKRYEHCDFENYDVGLYDDEADAAKWNRSLEQAKVIAQAFTRDYPVGTEHGLLLMGPCGVGKTHLAVAVLKEVVLRGYGGLFYDYNELLKEIQHSYNSQTQTTEMEVLEPVLTAELLVLDDLGASKPSPWALETVGHILNSRYNEKRLTILTTNYLDVAAAPGVLRMPSGQAVAGRGDESLADRVGQRTRSRLMEMCRTVDLFAPDYRERIRQAGRLRP